MDLFDGLRGALRRWYVLLPILILTAAVALVVNSRKTTNYTSTATIGVVAKSTSVQSAVPSGQPTVQSSNALAANGGTTLISNLLTIAMRQPAVASQVVTAGGTPTYSVTVEQRGASDTQLPIVDITATGKSATAVAKTMAVLTSAAKTSLTQLQQSAGVPSDRYVGSYVVQAATPPARNVLSRARNVGVVLVVGVIVAFVLAGIIDLFVVRRRERRSAGAHARTQDLYSSTGHESGP